MTVEAIKDQLAFLHFSLLATAKGCKIYKYNFDDGVDVGVDLPLIYHSPRIIRHTSMGAALEFQLKTTTKKSVTFERDICKFDLEVKNYNDLVQRKELFADRVSNIPLLLAVLVLEPEMSKWVVTKGQKTSIGGAFYWFYPSENLEMSDSKSTQRIEIPVKNRISMSFFDRMLNLRNQILR